MRSLLEHNDAIDFRLLSGRVHPLTKAITAAHFVSSEGPIGQFISASAPQDVRLPFAEEGLYFFLCNTGSADLTVKDAAGVTLFTLPTNVSTIVYTDGSAWHSMLPSVSYTVFGPTGPGHSIGLVPDPGPGPGSGRFLREDGQWASASGSGVTNAFSHITDGTNIADGTGEDTFRLRSSTGLSIVVGNNDVTYGDNALFSLVLNQIDHNSLLNYEANRHVDHTAVSITGTSGVGGGGNISANRSLSLDFAGLGAQAPVIGDTFAFLSTGTHFKATFSQLNSVLVHNNLSGYVANEHIDHTTVSISAGTGLTGGGTIATSRTLSLNITGLTPLGEALASGDEFAVYNVSGPAHAKVTFNTLNAALVHNSLSGYVANEHINHTGVTITGTGGLTGGGDISASRTLDMSANQKTRGIVFVIDGGGSTITTGNKRGIRIPFACTITAWSIGLDQSGSIVIDIWKDTQANYPPTNADTITASAKPTVSSATNATSSTLTSWTTSIAAGDWLFFNVDSVTSAQWAQIMLTVTVT